MESIALIFVLLLLLMVVIQIIYFFWCYLYWMLPNFVKDYINKHLLVWPLKDRYKRHLSKMDGFYHRLSDREKRSFEKRIQRFIDRKQFIHRGLPRRDVSDTQKLQIAATAIRLTFGHPQVYLDHFEKILVYEDAYYSTITKKRHQGEVNARGFIVLSWSNFQKGVSDTTDGIHLGYHEMAHALQLENMIENGHYNFLGKDKMRRVKDIGSEEKHAAVQGDSFFRSSAFSNAFEFFAVTVESFFERPLALKNHNQELYQNMSLLLKQDPIAQSSSFRAKRR